MRVALVDLDAPPAWFVTHQARDHLTAPEARAFARTNGRVLLLTNAASAGYVQNPISVYYCYYDSGGDSGGVGDGGSGSGEDGGGGGDADTPGRRRTRAQARREQQQQQQNGGGGAKQAPASAAAAAAAAAPPAWRAERLGAPAVAIAEVTNTPWGDRVRFAFTPDGAASPKALHVSPFMDMGNQWLLKAAPPGPSLVLSVLVDHPQLGRYFDAQLVARRCGDSGSDSGGASSGSRSSGAGASSGGGPGVAATARAERAGLRTLLRYGFLPQRVAFWIYWQAVVLIWKGVKIHAKPDGDGGGGDTGDGGGDGSGCGFKARAAAAAAAAAPGKRLPEAGGGRAGCGGGAGVRAAGCPFEWTDARAWPWYL